MIEITAEIRAFIDKAAAGVELAEDEYIDPSDGLIHCKKCGGQRQTVVPGDVLPLEYVQHGLSRRSLRLSVVGVAHQIRPQQIAPAVVPCVIILLLRLLDPGLGLLLRLHPPHVADEPGALLHKLALRLLKGDTKAVSHGAPPTPAS